ncbi:MAG: hypothetical protein R3C69_13985 [Geminicoccaceae bacterium]
MAVRDAARQGLLRGLRAEDACATHSAERHARALRSLLLPGAIGRRGDRHVFPG